MNFNRFKKLNFIVSTLLLSIFSQSVFADEMVRPEKVISVVTGDWNQDGGFDRALLVESDITPDKANLLIYLSTASIKMELALNKKSFIWRGAMWGTQPSLETNSQGALVILFGNDSIGRDRWSEKLTIIYRDKKFLVAGYTSEERDTLANKFSSCDMNFLTGTGIKNKKPFKNPVKPILLTAWSSALIPQECE